MLLTGRSIDVVCICSTCIFLSSVFGQNIFLILYMAGKMQDELKFLHSAVIFMSLAAFIFPCGIVSVLTKILKDNIINNKG